MVGTSINKDTTTHKQKRDEECPLPPPSMTIQVKRATAQEKGKWIPKHASMREQGYTKDQSDPQIKEIATCIGKPQRSTSLKESNEF